MKIVAKTDVGKIRENNQDSYAAGELPNGVAWAVVCDGMGGVAGGNVASSTAVKVISEQITSAYRFGMSAKSIKNMLISAITAANISVFDISKANEELDGMGTTVVCAIVTGGIAYIAHAGDSRAYLLSKGSLIQLTRDHSMVQDLVEDGKITEDEAKFHPRKNIITRALGVDDEIRIDFSERELLLNDTLLLCTDGLTNFVENDEICQLTNDNMYYEFADRLVSRANKNGGGDNITVVAIAY
ncbi:MAG: Stp1/IreP family PP2C-type Ser/Thr phosphatase [Oscillospiraceae bacterium]